MTKDEAIVMLRQAVDALDALDKAEAVPEAMLECMHNCRNAAMDLLAYVEDDMPDFCPVPDTEGVCRFEERVHDE